MRVILIVFSFVLFPMVNLSGSWDYNYYKKYSYKNFKKNNSFHNSIDFKKIDYPLLHAGIFYFTNVERVKHGLKALSFAKQLEIAAYNHSKYMVKRNFFSHVNPYDSDRRTTSKRARKAGIKNPKIAENIANSFAIKYKSGASIYVRPGRGKYSYSPGGPIIKPHTYYSFARAVVTQWMNSPGHRRNILSKKALQLGCGSYFFWKNNFPRFMSTQNFQWFRPIVPMSSSDKAPGMRSSSHKDGSKDNRSDDSSNDDDEFEDDNEY